MAGEPLANGGSRRTWYVTGWQPEHRGLRGREASRAASISIRSSKVYTFTPDTSPSTCSLMVSGVSQNVSKGPRCTDSRCSSKISTSKRAWGESRDR